MIQVPNIDSPSAIDRRSVDAERRALEAKADALEVEADINATRRAGLEVAMRHLLAGRRGRAFYELCRSVERQLRIAGHGTYPLPSPPPMPPVVAGCGDPTCTDEHGEALR